jgi:hypothetical protein
VPHDQHIGRSASSELRDLRPGKLAEGDSQRNHVARFLLGAIPRKSSPITDPPRAASVIDGAFGDGREGVSQPKDDRTNVYDERHERPPFFRSAIGEQQHRVWLSALLLPPKEHTGDGRAGFFSSRMQA